MEFLNNLLLSVSVLTKSASISSAQVLAIIAPLAATALYLAKRQKRKLMFKAKWKLLKQLFFKPKNSSGKVSKGKKILIVVGIILLISGGLHLAGILLGKTLGAIFLVGLLYALIFVLAGKANR